MAKSFNPKAELYEHTVLKMLHRESQNDTNRTDLMVIKWANAKTPVLEKRRAFFNKKQEQWMYRKATGMTFGDLKIVQENMDEIMRLLHVDEKEQ